ncbi:hypothetical protein PFISCL1PPCAC_7049 [Pristionchus fissidentatus]|uniref:RING-type domain-containing protein n=1 Tax=Pristionchus fissidentatus TaxID=1538716 RepID=A0AAV5VAE8_9BILA|nr:hypothetical protein PFISCL1PPCAC_7049 [Pristionchus fissidentatus]
MFVCKGEKCTEPKVLESDNIYDIHSDREMARVPTQPYGSHLSGKLARLCFLCSKKSEKHEKHEIVPISEVLQATLNRAADKDRPTTHENRKPWHISTLPPVAMHNLLEKYLTCKKCKIVYCKAMRQYPVMLDCSHIVCSECEKKLLNGKKKAECFLPDCKKEHTWKKIPRKIDDLQFATERRFGLQDYRPMQTMLLAISGRVSTVSLLRRRTDMSIRILFVVRPRSSHTRNGYSSQRPHGCP